MSISKLIYSKIQFWGQKKKSKVQKRGAVGTWNVTVWRWSQASKRSGGPGRFAHTRYQFAFLFLKIIIRDKKVVEFLLKKQKQNTDSVKRKWWRHYHGEKHVVWWRLTHILSGFALFLFDFWFLIFDFFFSWLDCFWVLLITAVFDLIIVLWIVTILARHACTVEFCLFIYIFK